MNSEQHIVVSLTRMFDAFGQVPTPSRIDAYRELLGTHEPHELEEAIRDAMKEAENFPPGPGTLYRALRAVRRARPGDPIEMPQQRGPRIGEGPPPLGALMSGLERRVERDYQRVIERSKEIRAEHRLPHTLDARLYSLGRAELDLNYAEYPNACRCVPRCDMRERERSLSQVRHEAETRLRKVGFLADAPVTLWTAA